MIIKEIRNLIREYFHEYEVSYYKPEEFRTPLEKIFLEKNFKFNLNKSQKKRYFGGNGELSLKEALVLHAKLDHALSLLDWREDFEKQKSDKYSKFLIKDIATALGLEIEVK